VTTQLVRASCQYPGQFRNMGLYRGPLPGTFLLAALYFGPARLLGLPLTCSFPLLFLAPGVPFSLLGLAAALGLFPLQFAQLLPLPLVICALCTLLGLFLRPFALLVGAVQLGSCRLAPCQANLLRPIPSLP